MDKPIVSVIVPVYNAEAYLEECIRSIMNQTLDKIEIICIDDGSSDKSPEILKSLQAQDDRIRIITQKNLGAGAARNNGLKNAEGEFLSFLDSDDFFEPDMLEKAVSAAKEYEADIVAFNSDEYLMNEDRFLAVPWVLRMDYIPPYNPFSYRELTGNVFKTFVGWAWDKLFRKDFVLSYELRFQEQRTTNDLLFVFSAIVLAERIVALDEIFVHQRKGNNKSLSVTREKSWHCFFDALTALRQKLVYENLYRELEQDFINYALHFSLWNLNTLAEPNKSLLKEKLMTDWFGILGIDGKPANYFYDIDEYEQYLNMQKEYRHQGTGDKYKVSVIVPLCGSLHYLGGCLDSIINQTLDEIEIICVDSSPLDSSLNILKECEKKSSKIKVIKCTEEGFGNTVKRGLEYASGEYVGIVRPDDYADINMFFDLYRIAADNRLDFVTADFYRFTGNENGRELPEHVYSDIKRKQYGKILNPSVDSSCMYLTVNICAGIYKREFLISCNIKYDEIPDVSFTDAFFGVCILVYANRAMAVNKSYYHCRRYSFDLSRNNKSEIYYINIEYNHIRNFLMEDGERWENFKYMYWWKKYHDYLLVYDLIDPLYKDEYMNEMRRELKRAMELGQISGEVFTKRELRDIRKKISELSGFGDKLRANKFVRKLRPFVPGFVVKLFHKIVR